MSKIRVGVLRGGPSSEYEVSLRSGDNVLRNLPADKYEAKDILLTKNKEWHMDGAPYTLPDIAEHVDVIFNALHGAYGEDGKIQRELEQFGIPYTGSSTLASALGMHKGLAKERFAEAGLRTPGGDIVPSDADPAASALEIFRSRMFPLVIKPVAGGSSVATTIAKTYESLVGGITLAQKHGDVLVEDMIAGKEATVCVVDASGGEQFVLFPIEIVPANLDGFFDYNAKYMGESQEICPGRFPLSIHSELRDLAIKAHNAIGARHYSRTDFIITQKGIFVLEINTLPGMTKESLFPKALSVAGIAMPEFLDHVIELALKR